MVMIVQSVYIYTTNTFSIFITKVENIFYSFCTVIYAVNYHCIIHIQYVTLEHKTSLKEVVHPKMKIPSSFTHPQVVLNLYEIICSAEHKGRYVDESM